MYRWLQNRELNLDKIPGVFMNPDSRSNPPIDPGHPPFTMQLLQQTQQTPEPVDVPIPPKIVFNEMSAAIKVLARHINTQEDTERAVRRILEIRYVGSLALSNEVRTNVYVQARPARRFGQRREIFNPGSEASSVERTSTNQKTDK